MNIDEQLLHKGLELLVPDEKRHPIVADHNDDIASLAFSIHCFTMMGKPPLEVMGAIKPVCETLFYLGYQAGRKAEKNALDADIWGQ